MTTTCITCKWLTGCRLLQGRGGGFSADLVYLEGQDCKECPEWLPIEEREMANRQFVYQTSGITGLKALHQIRKLVKGQEEDEVDEMTGKQAVEYYQSMIRPEMPRSERKEQLLYATDEQGNVMKDEGGNPYPRGYFNLRKYATEGPVGESPSRIVLWTTEELIESVLDAEQAAGLIQPDPNVKKTKEKPMPVMTNSRPMTPPMDSAAGPQAMNQTKIAKPTVGPRRVMLTSNPAGAAPSMPPRAVAAAGPAQQGPVHQPPLRADAGPALNVNEIVDKVAAAVVAALTPKIREVIGAIDFTRERITTQHTVMHDISILLGQDPNRFNLLSDTNGTIDDYLDLSPKGENPGE